MTLPAGLISYLAAVAIGVVVGAGELMSRYRDAPFRAIFTAPGLFYLALNGAAAWLALFLIKAMGWTFGLTQTGQALDVMIVLVAGFGALALFRSSLFNVKMGDQDVNIGPAAVLQILTSTADRAVDRVRATARANDVEKAMTGIAFQKAKVDLPTVCLALMQNLSAAEQTALGNELKALDDATGMDDIAKNAAMGAKLLTFFGPDVLKAAIKDLGPSIKI